MKKTLFIGCGTALVTPFTQDNKVNYEELKKLLEFQVEQGADSVIICGTTGEASTMSLEEKKQVIEFAVETIHKRIPVIAGTGGNCTKTSVELSQFAEKIGADGLLLVTPYYNKTTQKGLIAHFSEIAKNVTIPIILYNVPSRTGMNIEPETCLSLSKIPNIVGIKEASGNISQVVKIAKLCGDDLWIYSGNDDQILPILSVGGVGVISVLSNIMPKFVHNMVYDYLSGNFTLAKDSQIKAIPLIDCLFSEVNPIPIKSALNFMGYEVGNPRLPLVPMSCAKEELLKQEMKKLKIL